MVRIVVDHDLIASPVPTGNDVVIVRGDVPVEIAKPEAFPVAARKYEYMLRSKATGEASVCKRLIDAVVRIVSATTMSDPLVVFGMNVRNLRMTFLVNGNAVLRRGLLASCGRRSAGRTGSPGRSRTACGNVLTLYGRVTAYGRPGATALARADLYGAAEFGSRTALN